MKFTPVTNVDDAFGGSDWRPLLRQGGPGTGWKTHMIGGASVKEKLQGVILPSLDFDLELEDTSFPKSVGRWWSSRADRGSKRHFAPNGWTLPLVMYPYLGPNKEHWISPQSRKNMIGGDDLDRSDTADAFEDLRRWVKFDSGMSDSDKDALLKGATFRDDPAVPTRTLRYVSMAECRTSKDEWHKALVGYTAAAFSYLVDQTRWPHNAEDGPPRDPDWPRYMLGDPTNPKAALVWHVDKMRISSTDQMDTNVICFTEQREFLDKDQQTRAISQETLDARFVMVDPANWNFPTYEEQVQFMAEYYDAAVTTEMLKEACGHLCDVPDRRRKPRADTSGNRSDSRSDAGASAGGSADDDYDPVAAVTRSAPAPAPERNLAPTQAAPPVEQAAPTPPPTPAAPAPPADHPFWVGRTGEKSVQMLPSQIQAEVDAGRAGGLKVLVGDTWTDVLASGIVKAPPVSGPPVVPAENPPTVGGSAPPVVGGTAPDSFSQEDMLAKMFPHGALESLAPEKKTRAMELVGRAFELSQGDPTRQLPAEIVDGLVELMQD